MYCQIVIFVINKFKAPTLINVHVCCNESFSGTIMKNSKDMLGQFTMKIFDYDQISILFFLCGKEVKCEMCLLVQYA